MCAAYCIVVFIHQIVGGGVKEERQHLGEKIKVCRMICLFHNCIFIYDRLMFETFDYYLLLPLHEENSKCAHLSLEFYRNFVNYIFF